MGKAIEDQFGQDVSIMKNLIKNITAFICSMLSVGVLYKLRAVVSTAISRKSGTDLKVIESSNVISVKEIKKLYDSCEKNCAVFGAYYFPVTSAEKNKLESLKDMYAGKRCFIVGNGPSLNETDLGLLANEYTFGVNNIFFMTEKNGFRPSFYVCEGRHILNDNRDKVRDYKCDIRFFPTYFRDQIPVSENNFFFYSDMGFYREWHPLYSTSRFSYDCSNVVYQGQTVTYINLQFAYYLGFTEVYLIGVDFNYIVPETASVNGKIIISNEADVNHFHKDYFGKGKKWTQPQLEKQLVSFAHANSVYFEAGRKIYNATKGGRLELFERVNYDSLF